MDPGDPTSILFTKIRTLEPDFASKIIGYFLLHLGNRDLMRLALGPDTLLQSVCLKAKSALGLSSSNGSPSASTPLNPISRPINIHRPSLSLSSPRTSANGFMEFSRNPLSPSVNTPGSLGSNMISSPFQASSSLFASDGGGDASGGNGDLLDEQQLGNYLSFLNESSSKNNNDESADLFGFSADNGDAHLHKRSFSASDVCFGSEEPGFGGGGYNRFPYGGGLGDDFDSSGGFGSPDYVCRQQEEIARMKLAQRQRMAAAQFLAASGSPMSYDKSINFLLHSRNAHRSGGAGQFGDEGYWFGSPGRHERDEFMGMGDNSASKQIYLTFPADSSFTDEDVSNYFGNFGPVQDVRIPYQQKRMFGFVTFVHSETVRIILARGNPHFICDSRVLVKPYKEKGRILENRRQQQQQQLLQQMERGNFSPGSSPSGMDARDLFDCHIAPRMFSNTHEMLRRKAEQADLQQAMEFQRRRFLNLQLPDMDNESFHHHQRSLSIGSPVHFPSCANQSMLFRSENSGEEEGNGDSGQFQSESNPGFLTGSDNNNSQEEGGYSNHLNKGQETSLENALPDCFFASPSKTTETQQPESEKENCAALSVTVENKPASIIETV